MLPSQLEKVPGMHLEIWLDLPSDGDVWLLNPCHVPAAAAAACRPPSSTTIGSVLSVGRSLTRLLSVKESLKDT